jgi:hypothetical protein
MTALAHLFGRLVAIIMLRLGPQDLPPGRSVLLACIGMYLAVTAFSLGRSESVEQVVPVLILAVLIPLLSCALVLYLRRRPARWEQTVSALFGTSAILSAITLPISPASGTEPSPLVALFLLLAFFWSFAVDAHIWRHALEVAFSTGLALAVILFAVTLFIINLLAGPL